MDLALPTTMNKINIKIIPPSHQYKSAPTIHKSAILLPSQQLPFSTHLFFGLNQSKQIFVPPYLPLDNQIMEDKEQSNSPFFSTPFKNFNPLQLKNPKGILDSSSQKIKLNENNPFVTFAGSESIDKSPIKLEELKEPERDQIEQHPQEKSEKDIIFSNWRKMMKKSKKEKTVQKKESELKFTDRGRRTEGKIGKLLLFGLNEKNSSNLVYSGWEGTCISIACCRKCMQVFENFAAVGGHRRVCGKVKQNDK